MDKPLHVLGTDAQLFEPVTQVWKLHESAPNQPAPVDVGVNTRPKVIRTPTALE